MMKKKIRRLHHAAVSIAALLFVPAAALAQQYEKVTETLGEKVPARPFILASYGFIWVAVLVYVVVLARGLGRVKADLDVVRRKIENENKKTVTG